MQGENNKKKLQLQEGEGDNVCGKNCEMCDTSQDTYHQKKTKKTLASCLLTYQTYIHIKHLLFFWQSD